MTRDVNQEHKEQLTLTEQFAIRVINVVGTPVFFWVCNILVLIPLIWTTTLPVVRYISSGYLQLVLLPLIMIAQNLQSRHDALRAQADYEVDLKSNEQLDQILVVLQDIASRL